MREPSPDQSSRLAAREAGLRYATDEAPGFSRRRRGKGFSYLDRDGNVIRDPEVIARIRSIVIPPAWTDVWICPWPNGHLQATGRDARGRKQHRYHPEFRAARDEAKFGRLVEFAAALPRIRKRVDRDLGRPGVPREKVLAAVVRLLELTLIRVGNDEYSRLNQSFGLTTLRGRHVKVEGTQIRFRFKGKGGAPHEVGLRDRRLAALIRRCQDLPGQDLFQYARTGRFTTCRATTSTTTCVRSRVASSPPRTSGPGPGRCWPTARCASCPRPSTSRPRSGTWSRRSSGRPGRCATPRPSRARPTSTRKCSQAYVDGRIEAVDLDDLPSAEQAVLELLRERLEVDAGRGRTRSQGRR